MVKKIFIMLITVVALVAIGALVLNVLLPNVASTLVNSVEDMIFNATGMTFDFNSDGDVGTNGNQTYSGANQDAEKLTNDGTGEQVQGFTP